MNIETKVDDEMLDELEECPICGEMKDDVETRRGPYRDEIYGDSETRMYSCHDCYSDRAADI